MIAQPPISIPKAEAAIHASVMVDRPSRVALTKCHRDSRIAVTCQVTEENPHGSFTLEWEVEPTESPAEEASPVIVRLPVTATLHGHRIVIS